MRTVFNAHRISICSRLAVRLYRESMSLGCVRNCKILKTVFSNSLGNNYLRYSAKRTVLSSAYQCNDVWNQRLQEPLFKGIDLDDFFLEMDKRFKAHKKVAALDVDLFVNSINSDDRFEELEHILYHFRRTRCTVRTMDSTHHAVTRLLVDYSRDDLLVQILSNRIKYGIFPDHFAMNMAMDSLIERKNYKDASRVASLIMLQEDLDHPVTRVLSLYACHMHLREENPEPWHEETPVVEEDDEEELVRIPYLRNPYFDDHFDLTHRNHLIGKTLFHIAVGFQDIVGRSYMAVGLALFQKWNQLFNLLQKFKENKETVLKESVNFIESLVVLEKDGQKASTEQEPEDGQETPSTTLVTGSHLEKISDLLDAMEHSKLVVNEDLHKLVCAKLETLLQLEQEDIKSMEELFKKWKTNRESEQTREMTLVEIKERQQALDAKKKELQNREQHLFFFENEDKYLLNIAQIEKEAKVQEKTPAQLSEETYIPPEMPRDNRFSKIISRQQES